MSNQKSKKPVLVYDADCGFCLTWTYRWRKITKDAVDYQPYQKVYKKYPAIPKKEFEKAVQLIMPNGKIYSAAHAVYMTLSIGKKKQWMLWAYKKIPGFSFVSEFVYRIVARNRGFLYNLMRKK